MQETKLKSDNYCQRLYPDKMSRWIYLSLATFPILVFCVPFFVEGATTEWNFFEKFGAILLSIFGVVAFVYFLVQLMPGSWYLEITPDGFSFCTLYCRSTYRWTDIGPVRVHKDPRMECVAFDLAAKAPDRFFGKIFRAWSRYECKADGYVRGRFGMTSQALADLMNECRKESKSRDMA